MNIMRGIQRFGRWVMVATLAAGGLPGVGLAADASLDERVRALEKKLDLEQKSNATEHTTVKERVDAIEKDVKDAQQTISDKLGFEMHGFVAGSYLYNFNEPKSQTNTLRVFDTDANTFTLDQANINILRKKDEGLGYSVNLDFGKAAEIVGGATRWSNNAANTESHNSIELREAYLTYKLKLGDGITFKAGKFVTLLGAEVISNFDNQNANISRSISFGFGIPFTHTGLLASFPIGSMVNIDAGVVNGWDAVADNNEVKTFLGGLGVTPADVFAMYLSGTYGPEQNNRSGSKRGVLTDVFTIKPADMLTLIAEVTYGHETKLLGPSLDDGADWYGGCGYVIVKATDDLSFALRGEVFDDTDGTRFGLPGGPKVTSWEITPTVSYQIATGLLLRAEYRHDEADKPIFENSDGNFLRKGQDTIATQLVYAF